jgi:hypothetical protein
MSRSQERLLEGFARCRPVTFFVAFALYGGTLVAVPRVIRTR